MLIGTGAGSGSAGAAGAGIRTGNAAILVGDRQWIDGLFDVYRRDYSTLICRM